MPLPGYILDDRAPPKRNAVSAWRWLCLFRWKRPRRLEIVRQGKSLLPCEVRYGYAPFPRHALNLPFVDSLPVERAAGALHQDAREDCPAAQAVDEFGMTDHAAIVGGIIRRVKPDNLDDARAKPLPHNFPMTKKPPDPYAVEVGARVTVARLALKFPQRRGMAREMVSGDDVEELYRAEDRLRKYETGEVLTPPAFVNWLRRHYGISADYIYNNDLSTMRPDLAADIRRIEHDLASK